MKPDITRSAAHRTIRSGLRSLLPVLLTVSLTLGIVLLASSAAWACPGCKDALAANDSGQGNLVAGYFWSILFMMSMPFILLGTYGGSMYLAVRRARAKQAAEAGRSDKELIEA